MKKIHPIVIFLLMTQFSILEAEISIEIDLPSLADEYSGIGSLEWTALNDSVRQQEEDINETLDKPLIYSAISQAAAVNSQIPAQGLMCRPGSYAFSLGGSATAYSYTSDWDELEENVADLDQNDDLSLGGGAQLIHMGLSFPMEKIHTDAKGFVSVAYADLSRDEYYYRQYAFLASIGIPVIERPRKNRFFAWTPLYAQGSLGYSFGRAGIVIEADPIELNLALDPDGSGDIPAQDIYVEIDPEVDVGLESRIYTLGGGVSTEISLYDSVSFYLGFGLLFSGGVTTVTAESRNPLEISGSAAQYLGEDGSVIIEGEVDGKGPDILKPYLFSGIQFRFSSLFIHIPILYYHIMGVGAGFYAGVSL